MMIFCFLFCFVGRKFGLGMMMVANLCKIPGRRRRRLELFGFRNKKKKKKKKNYLVPIRIKLRKRSNSCRIRNAFALIFSARLHLVPSAFPRQWLTYIHHRRSETVYPYLHLSWCNECSHRTRQWAVSDPNRSRLERTFLHVKSSVSGCMYHKQA